MGFRYGLAAAGESTAVVEVHQLILDGGFEVEEDGPAAGITNQVRSEASV